MTALPYRTTTKRQSLTTMAQTERAANQRPAKLRLENYVFVKNNSHVYLNSVQQMVSGELAGKGLQTRFSRHGLPPQRAPLDTVYPLREHLNSVQRMVSGGYCEGLFPDTVCWTRLRNTWNSPKVNYHNLLREDFVIFSKIIISK